MLLDSRQQQQPHRHNMERYHQYSGTGEANKLQGCVTAGPAGGCQCDEWDISKAPLGMGGEGIEWKDFWFSPSTCLHCLPDAHTYTIINFKSMEEEGRCLLSNPAMDKW